MRANKDQIEDLARAMDTLASASLIAASVGFLVTAVSLSLK